MKPELRASSVMDFSLSLCFVVSLKRTRDTKGALETLSSNATCQGVHRVFAERRKPPWARIASSVQSWMEDPSEAHIALAAGLQIIITQRKQGDFVGV